MIRSEETIAIERRTRHLIAETFQPFAKGLAQPTPDVIRAGKAGGLAFDSLTTDVCVGCLPASQVCYGSCFAARESFRLGVDFGIRVENTLDEDCFRADLDRLPVRQRYLRNGWHSDPSWRWMLAARVAEVIHDSGRLTCFVTKSFTTMTPDVAKRLVDVDAEVRVSVSALDTDAQLRHRLASIVAYQNAGGRAIPVLVSTHFRDPLLNAKQDEIVRFILDHDIPGAENSLRFDPTAPIAQLFDVTLSRREGDTADYWCGRLYPHELPVPTITSVPDDYWGVQNRFRSRNDPDFFETLFDDPVPTQDEVLSNRPLRRPKQAAVSRPERVAT